MTADTPKRRSANAPTKSDLWEELQNSRKELRDIAERMIQVVQENTAAYASLHSLVTKVAEQLANQATLTETLTRQATAVMCQQATGVPMKVFIIVVTVLAVIIATLVGIKASALAPIFGGG